MPWRDLPIDTARLSYDLQVALTSNADFVGLGPGGGSVLAFAADRDIDEALQGFPKLEWIKASPAEANPIKELLVRYGAKDRPGENAPKGIRIAYETERATYCVYRLDEGDEPFRERDAIPPEIVRQILDDPGVVHVEPNHTYELVPYTGPVERLGSPNDPYFLPSQQWGMKSINAELAWGHVTASGVIVAILDTGVDYTHEDLRGNMWVNPKETPYNYVDDDPGTFGFVDDVYGADFINGDGDPMDTWGHGTHCAGIIGAEGGNYRGVVGVNWNVRMMAVRILQEGHQDPTTADILAAIDYAHLNGARIITMSWHSDGFSQDFQDKIALYSDTLFVAAATNADTGTAKDIDIERVYPASFPNGNLITVLSVQPGERDQVEELSPYSNYGHCSVDIGAPGQDIFSTIPCNFYKHATGTSMAAPFVAGAAALTWGKAPYETVSPLLIKAQLLHNARPLPSLAGKCLVEGTLDLSFLNPPEPNDWWDKFVFDGTIDSAGMALATTTGPRALDFCGNDLLLQQAANKVGDQVRVIGLPLHSGAILVIGFE